MLYFIQYLFIALLSFVLVFISIPVILNVAHSKDLYATPGGRHVHKEEVPNLGGMGIFIGVLFSYTLYLDLLASGDGIPFLIPSMLVIWAIGLKDDIFVTGPTLKLLGQILAAALVVVVGGHQITEIHCFLGGIDLNYGISSLITIFFIVLVMNSFNLIDGVDGLAASLGIVSVSAISIWFFMNDPGVVAALGAIVAGALLAYLYFNVVSKNRKIFMGDTGSLLLGLLISVIAISFMKANAGLAESGLAHSVQSAPAIAFSAMIVPLADVLRVFVIRIARGASPFRADKSHIHHRLLTLGLSHLQITLVLVVVNILFIVMTWFLQHWGTIVLILLNMALSLMLFAIPTQIIRVKRNRILQEYREEAVVSRRIV